MTIKKKSEWQGRTEVDLTGPEGNAFCLMGMATRWGGQLGKDVGKILADMQSGDYEHLLAVMDREFGDYVTFYR